MFRRVFLLCLPFVLCSTLAFAASANFYSLSDKWEKANASGKTRTSALEDSFGQALAEQPRSPTGFPTPPPIRKQISQLLTESPVIEIELNQSLDVRVPGIVKFVSTDEGILAMETTDRDLLRITGIQVGSTFLHIWDASGRHTFELRVIPPKIIPTAYQERQIEAFEKSRPFRLRYDNNRGASYTGDTFSKRRRSSSDFGQNIGIDGDTPYGSFEAHAETQRSQGRNQLTDAQAVLRDARVGPIRNSDIAIGDSRVSPNLMVFPATRIRGVEVDSWNDSQKLKGTAFYGRELSSIIGTLTPGIVGEQTRDSFLSGGVVDYKMNDNVFIKAGDFLGYGQSRTDELNRNGGGFLADVWAGKHVGVNTETDYDSEHFAQKHALTLRFEKLRIRDEVRSISKKFYTLIGAPSRQGEIGNLLDVSFTPRSDLSFSGNLDIFKDTLIPNPDDPNALNIHTDLQLTYIPDDQSSLILNFQDLDDTGRIGPTRQRTMGGQYNRRFHALNRNWTFFTRYQNRGNRILTNSLMNYVQNQVIVGLYTQIFWGINFSLQNEWNALEEPNISRYTHPHAVTYTFDYNRQIGTTPFYMDLMLRIRDEEQTESSNSFMSGEDSTEIGGGLHYRASEDFEMYLTGTFTQYVPESLDVTDARIEAQFLTGMHYVFDTKFRWSNVGSFEGFVFKDANGDGVRQADEPGLKGMIVETRDGRKVSTDENGHYLLKSVEGKSALLTLDPSKVPYGFAPTTPTSLEMRIEQDKTQRADFGLVPQSEITGIIFNDLNGDGKYDMSDVGVGKVKLALDDKQFSRSNNIGVYLFQNVLTGPHVVSLVLSTVPDGYLPADKPQKNATLYEGIRFELNFPLRAIRQVTGRVYVDENKNGFLDSNEKTLSGVKVRLGSLSVESDAEGWYLFDNVNKGEYRLEVDPAGVPAGYQAPRSQDVRLGADPVTLVDMNIAMTRFSSGASTSSAESSYRRSYRSSSSEESESLGTPSASSERYSSDSSDMPSESLDSNDPCTK